MNSHDLIQSVKGYWKKYWIYLIPIMICSLVMLPRLLDPHFGLMDDGDAIQKANLILDKQWGAGSEVSAGRFRPLYWFIHYILFLLFGTAPAGYFIVNYLALVLLLLGIVKLLKIYGSSDMTILIACIFFVVSGPIVESYYTLSKYEIFQLLFIIYAILMSDAFKNARLIIQKILLIVWVFLFSLVSYLIKETSLIMPVIYLGWMILFLIRYRSQKRSLLPIMVISASSLAAVLVYLFWRNQYLSEVISAGSYVGTHFSLSVSSLISSLIEWEPWLRRDFAYCAVLIFTGLLSLVLSRRKPLQSHIYWGASIWMAGWLGVFLPWVIKIEYYLLPFALGCSILSAHILVDLFGCIRQSKAWKRLVLLICIGGAGILFMNSLMLIINNARYQLLMDNVNYRMMKYLVEVLPENGRVYINLPADNEYIKEIQLHFNYIYSRPDVIVSRFYYQTSQKDDINAGSYVISPLVVNRPTFSVRHAFTDDDSNAWSYSLEKYMADGIGKPIIISGDFIQVEPHIFRIICPIIQNYGSCESNRQIVESKQLRYQWQVYHYGRLPEKAAQPGIYDCGLWKLRQIDGNVTTFIFGSCQDTPLVGDWNGDLISDLGTYTPETNEWKVDWNHDGRADLTFTLDEMTSSNIPLIGDWDGDGRDTPGYFNSNDQYWHLFEGDAGSYQVVRSIKGGTVTSFPLIGDWNRDSKDSWGIYNPETGEVNLENEFIGELSGVDYLLPSNTILIVDDWFGTGRDTLAFIDATDWVVLPANCGCSYSNFPSAYRFPIDDGFPVSGIWP
jgi:hypothetical protein